MSRQTRRARSSTHRCPADDHRAHRIPLSQVMATGCRRMRLWPTIEQSRRCEPVQGANNGGDERVSTAVAGIVEDVKLTGGPPLRPLPRRIQRAADGVAAGARDAGNAVQCRCITEQLVLPEKGGVPPVVRDQAREPEAKFRIFVARVLAAINISETAFSP